MKVTSSWFKRPAVCPQSAARTVSFTSLGGFAGSGFRGSQKPAGAKEQLAGVRGLHEAVGVHEQPISLGERDLLLVVFHFRIDAQRQVGRLGAFVERYPLPP